jgi:hypothetical protein
MFHLRSHRILSGIGYGMNSVGAATSKKLGVTSGSVTQSMNRPQRERLPCLKAGISAVKKLKLTVVTRAGERFVFSEGEGVE